MGKGGRLTFMRIGSDCSGGPLEYIKRYPGVLFMIGLFIFVPAVLMCRFGGLLLWVGLFLICVSLPLVIGGITGNVVLRRRMAQQRSAMAVTTTVYPPGSNVTTTSQTVTVHPGAMPPPPAHPAPGAQYPVYPGYQPYALNTSQQYPSVPPYYQPPYPQPQGPQPQHAAPTAPPGDQTFQPYNQTQYGEPPASYAPIATTTDPPVNPAYPYPYPPPPSYDSVTSQHTQQKHN